MGAHVMFKDMAADPYLASAGIASDWPYGRGCWQSEDKKKIVWFGEEDQLRIMVMKKGFLLNEVFNELKELLDGVDFASTRPSAPTAPSTSRPRRGSSSRSPPSSRPSTTASNSSSTPRRQPRRPRPRHACSSHRVLSPP